MATLILSIQRNSGMYFYYAYGFLTLEQTYLCRVNPGDSYESCDRADICSQIAEGLTPDYMENTSSDTYIQNWTQEMGFMCTPRTTVQWVVTGYLLAYGVSGFLFWPVPDLHGRKKTMTVFGFAHLACQWVLLLCPFYWARLVAFAMMGFCQIKICCCYSWLFELVPEKHKALSSTFLNAYDVGCVMLVCLYFMQISKYWFPLYMTLTVLGTIT